MIPWCLLHFNLENLCEELYLDKNLYKQAMHFIPTKLGVGYMIFFHYSVCFHVAFPKISRLGKSNILRLLYAVTILVNISLLTCSSEILPLCVRAKDGSVAF